MKYDPQKHRRRSVRLKGYDYSQAGAYFVTICTRNRACLLGEVVDGEMRLNEARRVAQRCWREIPAHSPHFRWNAFVAIPNHVHGILWIVATRTGPITVGANNYSPLQTDSPPRIRGTSKTIGSVIRGFKIGVTKWMRHNTEFHNIWQRNYHEHIIRDEESLNRIRQYVADNPARWAFDRENPAAKAPEPENACAG